MAKYLYGGDWREKLNVEDEPVEEMMNVEPSSGAEDNEEGDVSLHAYINQIVPDEDDPLTYGALQFVKEYVGALQPDENEEGNSNIPGEKVIENESEAKRVADELNAQTRRRVLSLLSEYVREPTHRRVPTNKELIGWLQQPNKIRNYWCHKLEGLKSLIKDRGITLTSGRKTIKQMREALAGISNMVVAPT